MEIYVCSRGVEISSEYRWFQITESGQQRVNGLPADFQEEATSLIYSESPSVVLSRKNGYLLLLITAIQPQGRKDYSDRQIRISVAWITQKTAEYERAFSLLAANALDDKDYPLLVEKIAQAISQQGEAGFQGDFSKLSNLVKSLVTVSKNYNQSCLMGDYHFKKLARFSPQIKQSLAQELRQFGLPSWEGVLVVSTEIKKADTLKNAQVWRGISSLIESEDWQNYDAIGDLYREGKSCRFKLRNKLKECVSHVNQQGKDLVMNLTGSWVNKKLES